MIVESKGLVIVEVVSAQWMAALVWPLCQIAVVRVRILAAMREQTPAKEFGVLYALRALLKTEFLSCRLDLIPFPVNMIGDAVA